MKAPYEEISLFDHFLTVGIDSGSRDYTLKAINKNEFTVDIIDIYPLESLAVPKYLEHIKMWSFPDGYCVYDSALNVVNNPGNEFINFNSIPPMLKTPDKEKAWQWIQENKNTIHHFVMTDKDGVKRYCTTIMFHERMLVKREANIEKEETVEEIYVPKSASLISRLPYLDLQKQILRYLFYNVIITKGEHKKDRLLKIQKKLLEDFKSNKKYFGNERAEMMWDNMTADQRKDLLVDTIKENEFLTKKSSEYIYFRESSLMEFYVSALFSVLPLSEDQNEFSILKPFPTVEEKKKREEEMWRYRSANNGPLNLMNFSFQPIFDKLSIENIFIIFQSILLERQILIFSSSPRDIVYVCEALLSFIQPLKWNLLYIPFLPINLWQTLHVMVPFIIGLPSKYKRIIEKNIDTSEKVIIYLDTGEVSNPYENEKHTIPDSIRQPFLHQLGTIKAKFEDSQSKMTDKKSKLREWIECECVLNFRHAFYTFLLRLINNYTPFFLYSIHTDEKTLRSTEIFDHSSYLKSFPKDVVEFMKEFTQKTMMFANLLEESYKILFQSEHMKNKEYINECHNDSAYFIRSLHNIERVIKSTARKNSYISPEEFDFYENKVQADHVSKEIQIKGIIESLKKPILKDLLPYLVKYLVHIEQIELNLDISSILAPMRNPKKEYKFLFFKESSSKKRTQSNQSLREINRLSQLLPKFDKKRVINLHRMFGGQVSNNPTKIRVKGLLSPNPNVKIEKEDELIEASSKNKPKVLEKATSFNEAGASIIEDEKNRESFLKILNHKVWHECKYMKSNRKSKKNLGIYKSLQSDDLRSNLKSGSISSKTKGSKKNLNLPILLDALKKKHQINKNPQSELNKKISKNAVSKELNQSLNSTGIMQSSIPDELNSAKISNKENYENNNIIQNLDKKLATACNTSFISSNRRSFVSNLDDLRSPFTENGNKKTQSKAKIFFTGQQPLPVKKENLIMDSRVSADIKTVNLDLDSFFEKSICDTSRNKTDLVCSGHQAGVPSLKVNQVKGASVTSEEPNNSFQVFSYLISDMINQNSSIQYPSKKVNNKNNVMREKCLTVGDEIDYENETICILNEDDAVDILGRKTAEPCMYPFKSARGGQQEKTKQSNLFEYEENRFYTVGDDPDDSFNDGDCEINCSEKKIKTFEMVKCSKNVENRISTRSSITTKKINIFPDDAFKKGSLFNKSEKIGGRKKIFCDDKADKSLEGFRNGGVPKSFCHALPNENISVRGTRSFIESPSELKMCVEGIIQTGCKQLKRKVSKKSMADQTNTKVFKVPVFNSNENKKSHDFKNNKLAFQPIMNNMTVR